MANETISGVKGYVDGHCTIVVHFPVDWRDNVYLDCEHCPFYSYASHHCKINNSIPALPGKFVGQDCPLTFEDLNKERKE